MFFQLIASGDFFDVDGFLATTKLDPQRVFRRGEDKTQFSSGFAVVIAKASELSFRQQVATAVGFLGEHKDELSRLRMWPGVTRVEIILSPEVELHRSLVGTQAYCIPPSLVQACASLGMTVGIAVRFKWAD